MEYPQQCPYGLMKTHQPASELFPSIRFLQKNKDVLINPLLNVTAERTQAPLFVFENHIIHNFNKKLRATLNGRYQVGGQTTTNGIKDGNAFNNYGENYWIGLSTTSSCLFTCRLWWYFIRRNW